MIKDALPNNVYRLSEELQKYLADVSYEAVLQAVQTFVRQSALRLKAGTWVDGNHPDITKHHDDHLDFSIDAHTKKNATLEPFVEKHIVSPQSKIITIGDLHGNLESLVEIILDLQKKGFLDEDLTLIQKDVYLVFLGDYVNRMSYSVEVMLLLFHLHAQNIGSVFLLRGNHEITSCVRHFYDMYHDRDEHGVVTDTLLSEFARKFDTYYFPDLLYWFDYLPSANYIGCLDEKTGKINAVQFCHAGVEIGFAPKRLFEQEKARFLTIPSLDRYSAMQELLADTSLEKSVRDRVKWVFAELRKIFFEHKKDSYLLWLDSYLEKEVRLIANAESLRATMLGLLVGMFLTEENDDIEFSSYSQSRCFYLGKKLTTYLLQKQSVDNFLLKSIVRGHQHLNSQDDHLGLASSMLDVLTENNGCARQWDGLVYTLGDNGVKVPHQSYLIISLHEMPEQWTVEHFFKSRHSDEFKFQKHVFLGSF